QALKSFLDSAEAVVRSLISLYSEVVSPCLKSYSCNALCLCKTLMTFVLQGRNADSLAQYFGEDPARCPFEQVTSILVIFVNMFKKSRDENARTVEAEKKKMEKEKASMSTIKGSE
uniref:FH2 domain-containing protein n=1 Tax=Aegilops tauschii subsp. strangulata TaxID=200361 RepID=A0A453CKB0_AEGTS